MGGNTRKQPTMTYTMGSLGQASKRRNKIDTAAKVADIGDVAAEVAEVVALGGRRRTHKKKRGIRRHRKHT
jgi:hypothetical protein